ncbi:MAG: putative extracellular nuclease [Patiriisocius sp.]|jgi:predicted extracellular nuclease
MRNFLFLSFIFLCFSCSDNNSNLKIESSLKSGDGPDELHFVFYNVENLFDVMDDPKKLDDDFTPEGKNNWTEDRYEKKISQLAKVLKSMTDKHDYLPAVIGLAEVENKAVVEDLAEALSVSGKEYAVVHEESADRRGIDVAMMYRKDIFSEKSHKAFRIKFANMNYRSRDILYFQGELFNGETVNVFLNHWPSRREGAEVSEPRRLAAAKTLKSKVDDLLSQDDQSKIIIMGDFNDYPDNKSISQVLNATGNGKQKSELYNLAYTLNENDKGSYNYRGDWGMLDQAIVSSGFMDGEGLSTTMEGLEIYQEDFMMYYDKKYKEHKPNRTFGHKYFGGYSDHLPIVVEFKMK